eukprot:SAG11_NODE_2274_length_3591_cov_3.168671_4_plen_120_part_00
MDPEAVAAALAEDGAEERASAYSAIQAAVRDGVTAFVVACVQPLIMSVLRAPASKVGVEEWRRVSLLLYEMVKVDDMAVSAEMMRPNDAGTCSCTPSGLSPAPCSRRCSPRSIGTVTTR